MGVFHVFLNYTNSTESCKYILTYILRLWLPNSSGPPNPVKTFIPSSKCNEKKLRPSIFHVTLQNIKKYFEDILLLFRNQSVHLLCKSIDWFLYDKKRPSWHFLAKWFEENLDLVFIYFKKVWEQVGQHKIQKNHLAQNS